MEEIAKTHLLLRGVDGTLYALDSSVLSSHIISKNDTLEKMDDDMKIIDTMAFIFTKDTVGNPQANGNSCAFAGYAAEAFPTLNNGDYFIYLNLDFDLHPYIDSTNNE